jgi:hypothetical protein
MKRQVATDRDLAATGADQADEVHASDTRADFERRIYRRRSVCRTSRPSSTLLRSTSHCPCRAWLGFAFRSHYPLNRL